MKEELKAKEVRKLNRLLEGITEYSELKEYHRNKITQALEINPCHFQRVSIKEILDEYYKQEFKRLESLK